MKFLIKKKTPRI